MLFYYVMLSGCWLPAQITRSRAEICSETLHLSSTVTFTWQMHHGLRAERCGIVPLSLDKDKQHKLIVARWKSRLAPARLSSSSPTLCLVLWITQQPWVTSPSSRSGEKQNIILWRRRTTTEYSALSKSRFVCSEIKKKQEKTKRAAQIRRFCAFRSVVKIHNHHSRVKHKIFFRWVLLKFKDWQDPDQRSEIRDQCSDSSVCTIPASFPDNY